MIPRAAAALWLCAWASSASAQRYRVIVLDARTHSTVSLEFRPCIPAEGSDCGAWIDSAASSAERAEPVATSARGTSPDGRYSAEIRDGAVFVTARSPASESMPAKGLHGPATAVAMTRDSQYALATTAAAAGFRPEVCMIDLEWRSVIARFSLPFPPAGLAVLR